MINEVFEEKKIRALNDSDLLLTAQDLVDEADTQSLKDAEHVIQYFYPRHFKESIEARKRNNTYRGNY